MAEPPTVLDHTCFSKTTSSASSTILPLYKTGCFTLFKEEMVALQKKKKKLYPARAQTLLCEVTS